MDWFVRTCNTERMNIERLLARGFVVVGGLIWTMMIFASGTAARYADLSYSFIEVIEAGVPALIPAAAAVLVFVIGLYWERIAALILMLGAVGTIVFGLISGWAEPVLWTNVLLVVVSPLVVAAVLFLLAARTQRVCELEALHAGE